MALGSLLYDWFCHRDEVADEFPYKYLFMFVFMFLVTLAVMTSRSAAKANQTTSDP